MTKSINVIVAGDGSTRIETHGFAGHECRQASQFLVFLLGTPLSEQLTPEFHRTPVPAAEVQQNFGPV